MDHNCLTEKQIKSCTDSRKTVQRFFFFSSPKYKAYFRSFNPNYSMSFFHVFFFLVSIEIKNHMAATIAKKVTQYSVQLSTIDMPQIFSLIPYEGPFSPGLTLTR